MIKLVWAVAWRTCIGFTIASKVGGTLDYASDVKQANAILFIDIITVAVSVILSSIYVYKTRHKYLSKT